MKKLEAIKEARKLKKLYQKLKKQMLKTLY